MLIRTLRIEHEDEAVGPSFASALGDVESRTRRSSSLPKQGRDGAPPHRSIRRDFCGLALLRSVDALIAEADANLESAKLNRSYADIRAPDNGRAWSKELVEYSARTFTDSRDELVTTMQSD